jgi:hypothetical protein
VPAVWARSIARDTRLDRTVAVKVLPAHLSNQPELRQRFEREARTISSLNHPHICTLFNVGRDDGIDFLVMEYLDGETLAARLKKGALPPTINRTWRQPYDVAADGKRFLFLTTVQSTMPPPITVFANWQANVKR